MMTYGGHVPGVPPKNGTQTKYSLTKTNSLIELKLGDFVVKVLNDKHTKIHVDRFNISVIDRLIKIGMVWGGFDANSALLFQRLAEYSS